MDALAFLHTKPADVGKGDCPAGEGGEDDGGHDAVTQIDCARDFGGHRYEARKLCIDLPAGDRPVGDLDGFAKDIDAPKEAATGSVGFDGDPPSAFHRPVNLDGETRDAKFRTVTVCSEVFLGGRVYFCEHGTPELVWRSEWQAQTNATVSIAEFVVASSTPDSEAQDFAKLLNGENEKNQVAFDGGAVTVLSEAQYGERYGALTSSLDGRASIFGALVLRTTDRDALNNMLNVGIDGAESQIEGVRTLVRVSQFDALIEFID